MSRILFIAALALMLMGSCGTLTRPNVLLIVIDTLRAQNLSCYGYSRNTTPIIDSLAARGTLWTSCLAQSSWTLPGFASMLSGTSERAHRAGVRLIERRGSVDSRRMVNTILHPDAPYLPVLLRDGGYRTYGHFNTVYLDENHGFSRGFDSCACETGEPLDADELVLQFQEWLQITCERDDGEPFFALLHLFDPHQPYDPPAPFDTLHGPLAEEYRTFWDMSRDSTGREILDPQNRQHYIDLYDGEISFADDALGELFAFLRSEGLAENTVVIITADHGEEFLEHGGFGHGHAFYQEIIHVPLIMCGPGIPSGVVDTSWAGQFDLSPSVLTMAGLEVPETMEGEDLMSKPSSQRLIPSSGRLYDEQAWVCSVVLDGLKCLRLDADSEYVDYVTHLSTDPLEASLHEVENCVNADHYMLTPGGWDFLEVEIDRSLNPVLKDLGYF